MCNYVLCESSGVWPEILVIRRLLIAPNSSIYKDQFPATINKAPFTRPNFLWQISCVKGFLNVNLSKAPNLHGQKAFDK